MPCCSYASTPSARPKRPPRPRPRRFPQSVVHLLPRPRRPLNVSTSVTTACSIAECDPPETSCAAHSRLRGTVAPAVPGRRGAASSAPGNSTFHHAASPRPRRRSRVMRRAPERHRVRGQMTFAMPLGRTSASCCSGVATSSPVSVRPRSPARGRRIDYPES
ncbi:hypothetical protein DFH09DRAFT_1187385 [Mycena vulgaris]|nr:hypothetical protein DFH09DRAFT_1187385 [Mycena vulgaris]